MSDGDRTRQVLVHIVDRYGYVWRVVRDGGMATRVGHDGVVSIGIAALDREAGPLLRFDAMGYRNTYPRFISMTADRRSWVIDREGTCDGCAEVKRLVMAYDADAHNEPWLCAECVAEQPVTRGEVWAALHRALLPLCDDLPGEPPVLVAWSPVALAARLADALADNGWELCRAPRADDDGTGNDGS